VGLRMRDLRRMALAVEGGESRTVEQLSRRKTGSPLTTCGDLRFTPKKLGDFGL